MIRPLIPVLGVARRLGPASLCGLLLGGLGTDTLGQPRPPGLENAAGKNP